MARFKLFICGLLLVLSVSVIPFAAANTSTTPTVSQSNQSAENEGTEFDDVLTKATETTDLSDLSSFTSYVYVNNGFFSATDIFPKIANALVQAIFFLTKAVYVLATIVLSAVFNANVYTQLDTIVQFSGGVFEVFLDSSLTYMLIISSFVSAVSFIRKGKVPRSLFKFIGVMIFGMFLYSKGSFSVPGTNLQYNSDYNLSKFVRAIDVVSADFTADLLAGFDSLDAGNNFSDSDAGSLSKVQSKLFDEMVYQPFLHLNYKEVDRVTEKQVADLFATKGDHDEVRKQGKKYSDSKPAFSFVSIGHKIMVALASLFKALVVGLAIIVLGMISLVFKFLALIMVVFSVGIFFVAMIPGFGHVLENAGKSLIQFVFIGGLGLVFVRVFLYLVALIDGAVSTMTSSYYWVAILQAIVLYLIYHFRSLFFGIFSNGALKAKELSHKMQSELSNVQNQLSRSKNSNYRPILDRTGADSHVYTPGTPKLSDTLSRASTNLTKRGAARAVDIYDNWRYGQGETVEKAFAQNERQRLKSGLKDGYESVKDNVASALTLEKQRAALHDLAGHQLTPVQKRNQERQQRQLERSKRKAAEQDLKSDYMASRQFDGVDRTSYKHYRQLLFGQNNLNLPSKYDGQSNELKTTTDNIFGPAADLPVNDSGPAEHDFIVPESSLTGGIWNEGY